MVEQVARSRPQTGGHTLLPHVILPAYCQSNDTSPRMYRQSPGTRGRKSLSFPMWSEASHRAGLRGFPGTQRGWALKHSLSLSHLFLQPFPVAEHCVIVSPLKYILPFYKTHSHLHLKSKRQDPGTGHLDNTLPPPTPTQQLAVSLQHCQKQLIAFDSCSIPPVNLQFI